MRKRERRNKIIKMGVYIFVFCFSLVALNLYKNNIYPSGTDDLAKVAEAQANGGTSPDNAIDEGVEIVDEKFMEEFYTFEKEYSLKIIPIKDTITQNYYVIKKGDTLLKISKATGQDMNVLVENNPKLANGKMKVGDRIKVLSKNGIYYTVKRGDSIDKIAKRYKVTKEELQVANAVEGNKIRAGEELFIPDPDFAYIEKERKIKEAKAKRAKELKLARKKQKEQEKRVAKVIDEERDKIKGNFGTPMEWHGVSSYFGTRYHPIYRKYIFHKGIDMKARTGESVYAASEGEVIFAGWMGGYGKLIIIKHDDGVTTRYGHLNSIDVSEGQNVSRGSFIGTTGATGNVTGPHLHFEVRKNGTPVNPLKFIR